jgi:hypothetical protein
VLGVYELQRKATEKRNHVGFSDWSNTTAPSRYEVLYLATFVSKVHVSGKMEGKRENCFISVNIPLVLSGFGDFSRLSGNKRILKNGFKIT